MRHRSPTLLLADRRRGGSPVLVCCESWVLVRLAVGLIPCGLFSGDAAAEGVPPGPMSESEIFAQAAKRKQAAIEELTRLQLRVQCVSDAYLCSSLHDRCSQVRARRAV